MSARETSTQELGSRAKPAKAARTVRLNVEQASFAYAASAESAPTFTLGATSFQARERELVAILGPNASGKSTLLRLVSGTLAPLSGRVELDGQETSRLDSRTRAQRIAVSGNQYCFIAVGLVDKRVRLAEHIYRARHVQGLDTFIDDDRNSLYRPLLLPLQSEALLCR